MHPRRHTPIAFSDWHRRFIGFQLWVVSERKIDCCLWHGRDDTCRLHCQQPLLTIIDAIFACISIPIIFSRTLIQATSFRSRRASSHAHQVTKVHCRWCARRIAVDRRLRKIWQTENCLMHLCLKLWKVTCELYFHAYYVWWLAYCLNLLSVCISHSRCLLYGFVRPLINQILLSCKFQPEVARLDSKFMFIVTLKFINNIRSMPIEKILMQLS